MNGRLEPWSTAPIASMARLSSSQLSANFVQSMPKRDVKDGIGRSGAAAEAFQVFQIAAMDISAGCGQRLGARIAARKTEHLVACADKFRDNPGTDESCCTCHENTHRNLLCSSLHLELTKGCRPD